MLVSHPAGIYVKSKSQLLFLSMIYYDEYMVPVFMLPKTLTSLFLLFFLTAFFFLPEASAQQYRSQATATTRVGNPPITGTSGQPATNNTCPKSPFHQNYITDFAL